MITKMLVNFHKFPVAISDMPTFQNEKEGSVRGAKYSRLWPS